MSSVRVRPSVLAYSIEPGMHEIWLENDPRLPESRCRVCGRRGHYVPRMYVRQTQMLADTMLCRGGGGEKRREEEGRAGIINSLDGRTDERTRTDPKQIHFGCALRPSILQLDPKRNPLTNSNTTWMSLSVFTVGLCPAGRRQSSRARATRRRRRRFLSSHAVSPSASRPLTSCSLPSSRWSHSASSICASSNARVYTPF